MFAEILQQIFEIKQNIWLLPYKIRSKRKIGAYLKENADCVRVNIGSGSNLLSGWLNGEIWPNKGTVYVDASKRLPFEDCSVRFINCEHLIEHLDYETCQYFLKECFRVLSEDGALRVSTPNLEKLIRLYLGSGELSDEEILTHHRQHHNSRVENMCGWFNDHIRLWGHKFIFDESILSELLRKVGFSQIIKCEYGKSLYPELQGLEKHDEGVEWMKWAYVVIVEAHKGD